MIAGTRFLQRKIMFLLGLYNFPTSLFSLDLTVREKASFGISATGTVFSLASIGLFAREVVNRFASAKRLINIDAIINDPNFPADLKKIDQPGQLLKAQLIAIYLVDNKSYVLAIDIDRAVAKQTSNSREKILEANQKAIWVAIQDFYEPFLLLNQSQQEQIADNLHNGASYKSLSKQIEKMLIVKQGSKS